MSIAALAIATSTTSTHNVISGVPLHSASYQTSVWGDHFLKYASPSLEVDEEMEEHIEALKEILIKNLIHAIDEPLTKVKLIDSIQRLGVCCQFENENDELLHYIRKNCEKDDTITPNEDLPPLTLLFRLLR